MRKLFIVLLALIVAMPLMAQDKKMDHKNMDHKDMAAMHAPPAPLNDEYLSWMVGEWKGWSDGAMGKSEDWLACKMDFGGQFMMMEYKATSAMGDWTGGGAYTLNEKGEVVAFWIDSNRTMAKGKGMRDGDTLAMHWSSKMGEGTRTMKKVSDDKFTVTSSFKMGDHMMESKSEMTRVKKMTDKSE